jgi:hypothetical protein
LFTDEMSVATKQMIDDEMKPLQNLCFGDVEGSRIEGRVVSSRVFGYLGAEEL